MAIPSVERHDLYPETFQGYPALGLGYLISSTNATRLLESIFGRRS